MNQQERDEIRAKHKPTVWYEAKHTLCEECTGWFVQDGVRSVDFPCWFPCWAIKYVDTLDAWEAEKAENIIECAQCDFTDEELEVIFKQLAGWNVGEKAKRVYDMRSGVNQVKSFNVDLLVGFVFEAEDEDEAEQKAIEAMTKMNDDWRETYNIHVETINVEWRGN